MGPSRIKVDNRHTKYVIDEGLVVRITREILGAIRRTGAPVELVFLTDDAIRSLNRKYKKRDRATDVLSFDLDGCASIAISLDAARSNSLLYGTTPALEAVLYIIHGILHLYGYDDISSRDRRKMSEKQSQILERVCRKEDLSKVLMLP